MTGYAELAKRFGTPSYVYDLDRIAAARRDLFAALPEEVELFYAAKANPHPELLREMRAGEGRRCRAEISSTGELAAVLTAGFPADEILYTGPGKTEDELVEALTAGVRLFSVESLGDLRNIGAVATRLGVIATCLLRVNSANASATSSIRMTGVPSQFGFDSETLPELREQLFDVPGTDVAGAHFFPLSNAKDEASLIGEFQHTISVAARVQDELGTRFRFVDIGGGFSVPYAVSGERPVYGNLREAMASSLDEWFPGWRSGEVKFAVESGRYLVGDSGTLMVGVVNLKESRGRRFVILDGGINTFGGMSGLGRIMPVSVRLDDEGIPLEQIASLVGPLCTPGDVLGRDIELPALAPGDVVNIPNAGAYGPTASLLMFLGRPAPTEILVRGEELVSVSRIEHIRAYELGQEL
ncbi:type III PLP-dependent enzyme [Kitasatospora kifunensis]|uniref:Diaminopimelate decarboxylase n=1 Tax=Kitasatospora kifunensis TaxID=58351 RepID=A0A7W7VTB0_KITKI|nr:type III PLP-dependent enzyme [Kitasatospora kifunensis]MBB4922032.1 diaminopimelate decarboxylase [Kitasatospora kifunensis]